MRRGNVVMVAVVAAAVLLAGCQTVPEEAIEAEAFTQERLDDPIRAIGPGGELLVESGEFYFELLEGMVIDGDVEVTLENVGGAVHNFRIDNANGDNKKVEADPGETVTGPLNLFAGEYVFYCDIPGHRAAGMEGTLVVYPNEEEAVPVGEGESQGGGEQTDAPADEAAEDDTEAATEDDG